eukprot:2670955-Rhodomonas_salina.3
MRVLDLLASYVPTSVLKILSSYAYVGTGHVLRATPRNRIQETALMVPIELKLRLLVFDFGVRGSPACGVGHPYAETLPPGTPRP